MDPKDILKALMAQKAVLEKQYKDKGQDVVITIDEVNFTLNIEETKVNEVTQTVTKTEAAGIPQGKQK